MNILVPGGWAVSDVKGTTPSIILGGDLTPAVSLALREEAINWGYSPGLADRVAELRGRRWFTTVDDGALFSSFRRLSPRHGVHKEWADPFAVLRRFRNINRMPGNTSVQNQDLEQGLIVYPPYTMDETGYTGADWLQRIQEDLLTGLERLAPGVSMVPMASFGPTPDGVAGSPTSFDAAYRAALDDPYDPEKVEIRLLLGASYYGYKTGGGMVLFRGTMPRAWCPWLKSIDNLAGYEHTWQATNNIYSDLIGTNTAQSVRYVVHPTFEHIVASAAILPTIPGTNSGGVDLSRVVVTSSEAARSKRVFQVPQTWSSRPDDTLSGVVRLPGGWNGEGADVFVSRRYAGPEFTSEDVIVGPVTVDLTARTITVDPEVRSHVYSGSLVAALDAGLDVLQGAQISTYDIAACVYSSVQRSHPDPLTRTEIYSRAAQGGSEGIKALKEAILVAGTSADPAITMEQASRRAASKEFRYAYFFTVSLDLADVDRYKIEDNDVYSVLRDGVWEPSTDEEVLGGFLAGSRVEYASTQGTLQGWANALTGTTVVAGSLATTLEGEFNEADVVTEARVERTLWADNVKSARDILQFSPTRSGVAELLSASYAYGKLALRKYSVA